MVQFISVYEDSVSEGFDILQSDHLSWRPANLTAVGQMSQNWQTSEENAVAENCLVLISSLGLHQCLVWLWLALYGLPCFEMLQYVTYIFQILLMMSCLHVMARTGRYIRGINSKSDSLGAAQICIYTNWPTRGQQQTGGGHRYLRLPCCWRSVVGHCSRSS